MGKSHKSNYIPALGYHGLTRYYDVVVAVTTRERRFKQALIEQVQCMPGHKILDVACGTGTLAIRIKQQHPDAEVTGVDGDAAILRMAINKAHKAQIIINLDQALSYSLPYPDAHFDRVASSLFFHHLSLNDKVRTASEIYRVLKPGGELHIADWGKPTNRLMRGLFYIIQLLDGFSNTQDNVEGRLIELFEQAGFIDVSQRKTFGTMFGTLALYRGLKPKK